MRKRDGYIRWSLALSISAAALVGTPAGSRGADRDIKAPSPAKALQSAIKSLKTAKSYRARVDIKGGFATEADHEVTEIKVKETYEGEVYGTLMHVPSVMKAYRTPTQGKGAAYINGGWKDILSNTTTVKLERLFKFPEQVLVSALKQSRGARWIEKEPSDRSSDASNAAGVNPGVAEASARKAGSQEDEATARGKTVVVGKGASGGEPAQGAAPRWLRVDAQPEEALAHLIEVQNSNCFGVG